MSPEERQLLTDLYGRIRGAASTARDQEAEALIQNETRAQPYAPYYLAQTVLVQDQALRAANDRLQELEGKVKDLESQAASKPSSGGFLSGLGSLFGGGGPSPAPRAPAPPPPSPPPPGGRWGQSPPPPQGGWQQPPQGYPPPGSAPGPWGGQGAGPAGAGGGFLKGALGTAAGVAGGVLLADSIRGLFAGHGSPYGIGSGFGGMEPGIGGETIVNNYYESGQPSPSDQDALQDAQQDADDNAQYAQDAQQDADQDQGDIQDASDYGSDDDVGSDDDGSYDV
jgi:uncharacterized protein